MYCLVVLLFVFLLLLCVLYVLLLLFDMYIDVRLSHNNKDYLLTYYAVV